MGVQFQASIGLNTLPGGYGRGGFNPAASLLAGMQNPLFGGGAGFPGMGGQGSFAMAGPGFAMAGNLGGQPNGFQGMAGLQENFGGQDPFQAGYQAGLEGMDPFQAGYMAGQQQSQQDSQGGQGLMAVLGIMAGLMPLLGGLFGGGGCGGGGGCCGGGPSSCGGGGFC